MFKVIKKSKSSKARLTILKTPHGEIRGPFFMPIATRGAVKNLTSDELKQLGAQIILLNTYHLFLRPGINLIKKVKGLHRFINWSGPILTDSGGYQIFSLSKHRKITEQGVYFINPQNGEKYFLSPELAIKIQKEFNSDIMMTLDECPAYPCSKKYAKKSLELTTRWAKRCKETLSKELLKAKGKRKIKNSEPLIQSPLLFGIIQGSTYKDLRYQSAKEIINIGFDGYAIGGVSVGEPRQKFKEILNWVMPLLPENKPRYLMGVGKPEEIISAVKQGIDMFDCVIPTREARHGRLYLWSDDLSFPRKRESRFRLGSGMTNKSSFYKTININNAKFAKDLSPINNTNLKQYSKAYLHHLFKTNEPLGMRLATLNNLEFYLRLMREIRQLIKIGKF